MDTMIHRSSLHVPARGPRRSSALAMSAVALIATVGLAACGNDEPSSDDAPAATAATSATAATADVSPSVALIGPAAAEALLAAPPAGLVVLDVRTPEEFAAGHLEGAVMIDFQSPTFAADVVGLGEDTPVFVYCRSGNRSAQAVATMVQLGFTDITELDGGVVAWEAAGLPLV
jgi:phage shock protein E